MVCGKSASLKSSEMSDGRERAREVKERRTITRSDVICESATVLLCKTCVNDIKKGLEKGMQVFADSNLLFPSSRYLLSSFGYLRYFILFTYEPLHTFLCPFLENIRFEMSLIIS